ncbi:MAG: hypothetical protein R3F11_07145 [Verrucomicrobiales bacterium]
MPFAGDSAAEVLGNVGTGEAAALPAGPQVSADLADLIRRLLAKDPADRPRDAAAAARALGTGAPPSPRRRRFAPAVCLGAAAIAGLAAFMIWQVPAARQAAGKAIAAASDRPFLISGQLMPAASLAEAVEAAADGDTITLPGGARIEMPGIEIDKRLTLRGVPGQPRPILVSGGSASKTSLLARRPLRFEHLAFESDPGGGVNCLIRIRETSLHATGCRFATTASPRPARVIPRVLELADGGEMTFEHCEFAIGEAIPIGLNGTRRFPPQEAPLSVVRLRDCTAEAEILFHSRDWTGSPRQRLRLELERFRFSGRAVFKHAPRSPVPDLDLRLTGSDVEVSDCLLWFDTNREDEVRERLRCEIADSQITEENAFAVVQRDASTPRAQWAVIPLGEFAADLEGDR